MPMTALDSPGSAVVAGESSVASASKPRRVRTGCLTCRERHLKCDEGLPHCQNCKKSGKTCRRGMKLNFHWMDVRDPAILPPTADWSVQFQDESRLIASEYKGGLGQYRAIETVAVTPSHEPVPEFNIPIDPNITMHSNQNSILQPGAPGLYPESKGVYPESRGIGKHGYQTQEDNRHLHSHTGNEVSYMPSMAPASYGNPEAILAPPDVARGYLSDPQEVLLMQVFVEEVGLWMDSMDKMKHFSRLLPFHALQEPMLLNAFLACGARHLSLVNPLYHEDKALTYYDTATTLLLRALQNPDRDTVVCATSAVILNVYEIMSERAAQRMNHIAGARALIKECGWNARSTGIGAACFWVNVGMELLSCLHFNWQVAWEPDQWGVDMDFSQGREGGSEELWTHRMVYITGKISNFRATTPKFPEATAHEEQLRQQRRYAEWQDLKNLCDSWNQSVPRTMHPVGFLFPHQTSSKSLFPEVWLLKRSAITGRLFYHTAMCVVAQNNPMFPMPNPEMASLLHDHAHQICGIVAHVKDRGVASIALRSLALAGETLVQRDEQEEVIRIFEKVQKETGWNVTYVMKELRDKWGWISEEQMLRDQMAFNQFAGANANMSTAGQGLQGGQQQQPQQPPKMIGGILNPLLARADFSLPNHPYQAYYQPPRVHDLQGQGQYGQNYF
ncbi:hypothetical protein V501_01724 [Pseudogymnoascus sp. VKM F-4519 (FW-2642)]|nr:hypothetical protein V501_01724 [Pseudogymnoascus sp. VKM F-4519 (FW-2642)]